MQDTCLICNHKFMVGDRWTQHFIDKHEYFLIQMPDIRKQYEKLIKVLLLNYYDEIMIVDDKEE